MRFIDMKDLPVKGRVIGRLGITAACIAVIVMVFGILNKDQIFDNLFKRGDVQISVHTPAAISSEIQKKETAAYSPGTVQYRLQTEKPVYMGSGAMADFMAPINKNIQSLFASSQSVIRGYVYSTEYFWVDHESGGEFYTKSVFVVEKSYKPGIKEGDKISVFEWGGVTTLRDWIENSRYKVKKDFETIPSDYDPYQGKSPDTLIDDKGILEVSTLRIGQEAVLFLKQYKNQDFGSYNGLNYWINSFEGGKLVLENGIYNQIIPEVNAREIEKNSVKENDIDKLLDYAAGKGEKPETIK